MKQTKVKVSWMLNLRIILSMRVIIWIFKLKRLKVDIEEVVLDQSWATKTIHREISKRNIFHQSKVFKAATKAKNRNKNPRITITYEPKYV